MIGQKLKAVMDEAGLSYKTNSRSYILACPRCRKKDKLYIRKNDGRFVCWVCKESDDYEGKPEFALTELTGLPIAELRRKLYGNRTTEGAAVFLNLQLHDFFGENDELPIFVPEDLPEMSPDPGFRPLLESAGDPGRRYLESRGIPSDVATHYGIQFWPAKNSVVFPAYSRGKLMGWQTRYIGPTEFIDEESGALVKVPKAMTSVGFKKERALMFSDRINAEHAVLCEGPIDALKAHLCGGNVAALGKGVSSHQLELLKHSGITRLYLALDPDAFVESQNILKLMVQYVEVYDMRPPQPYKDLGEMPMEEVKVLMDQAPKLDANHMFLYLKDPYAIK